MSSMEAFIIVGPLLGFVGLMLIAFGIQHYYDVKDGF